MFWVSHETGQLEVDQAQADLGGGDPGAEHLRPADGHALEQVGGIAVAAAPVADRPYGASGGWIG